MPAFGAKEVQELRKSTGAGMMDAKKALTEADGDFERATRILREKGLAKAAARADRENSEGVIAIATNDSAAAMVQLKTETDFAAKSDDLRSLADELAAAVAADGVDAVNSRSDDLEKLKLTVKENIDIGRVERYEITGDNVVDAYLHGEGRAGVLIEGRNVDAAQLHEIALHVAFAKPTYLSRDQVPADEVEKEKATLLEITKAEGKPEAAWPKIVEGRLNSWYGERVLLEQGVFGEKETVRQRLGEGEITRFAFASIGI